MGHSDNSAVTGTDGSATGPDGGAPVSPVRAFLLLLALLVGAGLVLWMTTRPERAEPIRMAPSQGAGGNGVTDEQPEGRAKERPTKAEAKKIFRDLRSRAYETIEARDLGLLREVYTSDGPLLPRVRREVRSLIRDDVIAQSRARLLRLRVLVHNLNKIAIRSKSRFFPCFIDAAGRNVTIDRSIFEEVATWTLQRQHRDWRIHDHVQDGYKSVGGNVASCP